MDITTFNNPDLDVVTLKTQDVKIQVESKKDFIFIYVNEVPQVIMQRIKIGKETWIMEPKAKDKYEKLLGTLEEIHGYIGNVLEEEKE